MQSVKIYNQNCVLAGRRAPEDAPEGDTTTWTDTAEDIETAREWAAMPGSGSNISYQRRVGREVLAYFFADGQ